MKKKTFCLRKVDLYRGISESELIDIADEAIESYIDANTVLYNDGDKEGNVYVLKEGEVELYKIENGKEVIVETLFPGDVFGEFGLGAYTHFARTTRKSYLCQTPTPEFLQIIKNYPEIVFRLMQIMAERTSEYENKIAHLSAPAKDQLYYILQQLFEKNKKRFLHKVFSVPFKISHLQLAKKTGLNRVTVTKLMSALEEEGKISIDRENRGIEVL